MTSKSEAKAVQFEANLPQLQNLMKRDPESYRDEFQKQWQYFHSLMSAFQLSPTRYNDKLDTMITFIAQVSHCYKEEVSELPRQVGDLLVEHSSVLDRTIRMTLLKAIIMCRNKDLIDAAHVLRVLFKLLHCEDKLLRKTIFQYVVSDIKNINAKHKNNKLNSSLQTFMFSQLQENSSITVKTALDVLVELYRRGVWNDAKTVNVIATACFHKVTKVMVAALKFFLGREEGEAAADSESEEDNAPEKTVGQLTLGHRVGKKTQKRKKKLDRALAAVKKHKKKKTAVESYNFSALHLLYDPQGFSERLFKQMEKSTERFEVKLMMIDLTSRLIGLHKLLLLNFYPFMKRFLQPHQREVTRLLLYVAQASHEVVPPDTLEDVLKTLANNFISERNSGEVMAVGLNAVREVCARAPLAIGEDLLRDLVQYKSHRDKAVFTAARSLISLFRATNPNLLHRKDRGRPTEGQREVKVTAYGEAGTVTHIPGAEVIPEMEEQQKEQEEWDSASDDGDSDSEGDWVDVHHSSDEEVEKVELTPEEIEKRKKTAQEVSTTRILTDSDFNLLAAAQVKKDITAAKNKVWVQRMAKKRKKTDAPEDTQGELPRLHDIEMVKKRKPNDKESKMATVQEGREGREKFGHGRQKMNPHASTSNKDKLKKKVFTMVKHKIRRKTVKKSFKEKQVALRNALIKRAKNSRY